MYEQEVCGMYVLGLGVYFLSAAPSFNFVKDAWDCTLVTFVISMFDYPPFDEAIGMQSHKSRVTINIITIGT